MELASGGALRSDCGAVKSGTSVYYLPMYILTEGARQKKNRVVTKEYQFKSCEEECWVCCKKNSRRPTYYLISTGKHGLT